MGLHWPELIIVLAIAMIFLGPKRLPEAGKSLGKAIRGFRDETQGLRDEFTSVKDDAMGLHQHVADVRDTVQSTVTGAVSEVAPTTTEKSVAEDGPMSAPLTTGSSGDPVK